MCAPPPPSMPHMLPALRMGMGMRVRPPACMQMRVIHFTLHKPLGPSSAYRAERLGIEPLLQLWKQYYADARKHIQAPDDGELLTFDG